MEKKQTYQPTRVRKFLRPDATPLSPEDIEEIKNAPSNIPNAGRVMCKKYRIGMTRYRDIINNRIPREPTEEWLRIVELVKNSSAPTILPENPNRTDENTLHLESSVAPINLPVPVVVGDTKKKSKSVRISDSSSNRKKSTEGLGGISTKKETILPATSQETEDVLESHKRSQKEIEKIRASGRILASKLSVP